MFSALRLKKSCYSWQTRGKTWLTSGRTDGSGWDWVSSVRTSITERGSSVEIKPGVMWKCVFVCVCVFSPGGAPVLPGRRCGRGVAAGSGAVPVQQGDRPERGRGGETHQTPRGLREVSRHLGGTLRRSGEADHGETTQNTRTFVFKVGFTNWIVSGVSLRSCSTQHLFTFYSHTSAERRHTAELQTAETLSTVSRRVGVTWSRGDIRPDNIM